MFCLLPTLADKFITKIRSGEIDPGKLATMSSKERHAFFKDFLGEDNATQVNRVFESKLLLKNQQQGIVNWAKQVTGIKPEVARDLLSRASKMTEILNPKNEQAFLEDLAAHRLGTAVTMTEAAKISELSKDAIAKKEAIPKGSDTGSESRLSYGRAKVAFDNYVADLKNEARKKTIVEQAKNPGEMASKTAGFIKAMKATADDSAIFRQGWKTMFTNPTIWAKRGLQSFSDIARTFGNKPVMDEVNADIVSRDNAVNGNYKKAKLDVGSTEEQFPTSLPEKIPFGVGKVFKASEVAYTAFLHKVRADVFDQYIEIAKKEGVELNVAELESIGKMVNSLTGRGSLGKAEPVAGMVNNIFFSAKKLKSDFDFLTMHQGGRLFGEAGPSKFVRKQAAKNLTKVIVGTAAILYLADKVSPGSVEKDARSSDFGKIKVGNTRFDVTGGMASMLTLAMRLIRQSTKSSTTGKITQIDSGKFGAPTTGSVITDYFGNKLSPAIQVIKDLRQGHDFNDNPVNLKTPKGIVNTAKDIAEPIPISTFEELRKDPNSANDFLAMLADALGISTNTYSSKPKKKK